MYREKLHIPMVLGRMSTSANSVEIFQQSMCNQGGGRTAAAIPADSAGDL